MVSKQYLTSLLFYGNKNLRSYSRKVTVSNQKKKTSEDVGPSSKKILSYFAKQSHLNDVKSLIPSQYLKPNQYSLQHLYLIDKKIVKDAVLHILPHLRKQPGIICETNAGLGLITSQLLSEGIEFVRIYESCGEFRDQLKNLFKAYITKVRIYDKDFYHMPVLSYLDRITNGNRVDVLLQGVPRMNWKDEPVMTIIGPMAYIQFMDYLIKTVVFQSEIVTYGRIQLFAFIKWKFYLKLTSKAGDNLRRYTSSTILFQLFFDLEFLEKYPRQSFLPWDNPNHSQSEDDYVYLVRICCKKTLPTDLTHLLHLYYFIKQGFRRGKSKVIPILEKWFPGIGINLIVPSKRSVHVYKDLNIYTEFGELSPLQILHIFHEAVKHPDFKTSSFMALVDSLVMKAEGITVNDQEKSK